LSKEFPEIEHNNKTFVLACRSDELYERKAKNIYFEEELQVAIFRIDGKLFAVSNICPHQHAAVICEGFIEELTVTCPLHGWIYSLENGKALGSHARLKTYEIFESNDEILLEKPILSMPKWMENL
jgi:NAD(P)H-dependent nitrite reductase small subunit